MKKLALLSLGLLLLLAVPACSNDKAAEEKPAPVAEAKAPETEAPAPVAEAPAPAPEAAMVNATAPIVAEAPMANATAPMTNATAMDHSEMNADIQALNDNYSDRIFLSNMLPHHSAAVDMCNKILKTTQDAKIKGWAEEMGKTQRNEIVAMLPWLEELGRKDEASWNKMSESMKAMRAVPLSDNADADFVLTMIKHHSMAVDMANIAEAKSTDPKIKELAKNIVDAQTREIAEMRKWLADNNIPEK